MGVTLSQTARKIAAGFVGPENLEEALRAVGTRAERPIDSQDVETKAGLVSYFVRNLRDLTVEASTELERQMLQAVGATPKGEKSVPVKDNISVITLRNHVRYLCVVLGAEWSLGMLVQSAISDLARFVLARGGGFFVISVQLRDVHFRVHIDRQLEGGPGWLKNVAQDSLLAGLKPLARDQKSGVSAHGSVMEFFVECSPRRGAR
jgi:hypothetical protein